MEFTYFQALSSVSSNTRNSLRRRRERRVSVIRGISPGKRSISAIPFQKGNGTRAWLPWTKRRSSCTVHGNSDRRRKSARSVRFYPIAFASSHFTIAVYLFPLFSLRFTSYSWANFTSVLVSHRDFSRWTQIRHHPSISFLSETFHRSPLTLR